MPLLLPQPKLLAPTPRSLASPPGQVLPNVGTRRRCRRLRPAPLPKRKACRWQCHGRMAEPSHPPAQQLFYDPGGLGVSGPVAMGPEEGTSHCSSASHQPVIGKMLLSPMLHLQPLKIKYNFPCNHGTAYPQHPLPLPGVLLVPKSEPPGPATHVSPQAGTRPGASPAAAHTKLLPLGTGRVTPGSILCPL